MNMNKKNKAQKANNQNMQDTEFSQELNQNNVAQNGIEQNNKMNKLTNKNQKR